MQKAPFGKQLGSTLFKIAWTSILIYLETMWGLLSVLH